MESEKVPSQPRDSLAAGSFTPKLQRRRHALGARLSSLETPDGLRRLGMDENEGFSGFRDEKVQLRKL